MTQDGGFAQEREEGAHEERGHERVPAVNDFVYLSHHQGERYDGWHEEEPGRIAHMIRT